MATSSKSANLTILFADIAGSTRLYDRLGDAEAYDKIVSCLSLMGSLVKINQGKVVETIGDEIMCSFENPNHAVQAASAMHEAMKPEIVNSIGVRVGMHSGLTGIDNGHPFGDVVNVAARMAGLARSGQIITTKDTVQMLDGSNRANTRAFDRVMVKGKPMPIDTFEIVWDQGDSTSIFPGAPVKPQQATVPITVLTITYQGVTKEIDENEASLSIGRSTQNIMSVASANASRNHSSIEFRSGHIIYTDHSTNGSYIRTEPGKRSSDGLDFFLHRDEWSMGGTGVISLGEPIDDSNEHLIHFSCSRR